MSDIKFECSQCRQHLACDEQDAGKEIQCPACNQLIRIPAAGEPVPPAGPSRLRITKHDPVVPAESVSSPTEPLQSEAVQPAAGRPRSWRWVWRLVGYAVLAAVLIIFLPKLTKLPSLAKPSNLASVSVQTFTVQFALLDSAGAKPDGAKEATEKFVAALKENFGHSNFTACSGAPELNQWLEQWPIGGAFKVVYNRDNTEVVMWGRVDGRNAIIRKFLEAKEADLPGILKQAKEGIEVLSKSS